MDIQSEINQILGAENFTEENDRQTINELQQEYNAETNSNFTDPIVCHDPVIGVEGITKTYRTQKSQTNGEDHDDEPVESNSDFEMTTLDGIEYPLIVVNNRLINNIDISYMNIDYTGFLTKIKLVVYDKHEAEQKLNTSQMSGMIRVCMISPVDKVYKKILLNFRIDDVSISEFNSREVTYYGTYYVEGFKQINMKNIYMQKPCPQCGQGGNINANTWEMLHEIASQIGLGFASTQKCKEINDRLIRNICSQRYGDFITQQLEHSGLTESNIFDAWIDLYNYIVMVNVSWVFEEDVNPEQLTIICNLGFNGNEDNMPTMNVESVQRVLTNYNKLPTPNNMQIRSYNMKVNNSAVRHGTLERVYSVNFDSYTSNMDILEVQTKQDSVDGDFLEDYNTGKSRPMPVFNFNDPKWTGLEGGYDINQQRVIRNAFFRKKRQSMLHVVLDKINLGLQRGTLVDIAIFDNDPMNKKITLDNMTNLAGPDQNIEPDKSAQPSDNSQLDILTDESIFLPNIKLSGLYYIDGMQFEYSADEGEIIQTLFLIKKGVTSGYYNKHSVPKMDYSKYEEDSPQPKN